MPAPPIPWPHAPPHQLSERGTYFITAGTYQKQHHFGSRNRLRNLQNTLFEKAAKFSWHLQAWALFSNHYHLIAASPDSEETASSLSVFLKELHGSTAHFVNALDEFSGRHVWHNFRETKLTYEASYFARLHYVHTNPVKHGLVPVANQYPWCSAAWFEQNATPAQVKTIYSFKTDQLNVQDDYSPFKG